MTPAARAERRWLAFALLVFLLAKAGWAVVPMEVMRAPRLGDDALVYLVTGAFSVIAPRDETPAIRTIREIAADRSAASEAVLFERDRVGMRTTGVSASPWAIATGALLEAGLAHRVVFAVTEVATAAVLGIGAAAALAALFGARAAGFGLLLLAIAVLPRQGLHYLVPSVLTLGLSLGALALLLRRPSADRHPQAPGAASGRLARRTGGGPHSRPRPASLAAEHVVPSGVSLSLVLLVALAVSIHTIGKAYAAILLALAGMLWALGRLRWTAPAAVVAGAVLGVLVERAPGTRPWSSAGLARIAPDAVLPNLAVFLEEAAALFLHQAPLLLLAAGGLALLARRRGGDVAPWLVLGVVAAATLGAAAVELPGYPAELMLRLLVAAMVLVAGLAGLALAALWRWRRLPALAALAAGLAWQVPAAEAVFRRSIADRHRIWDEALLRAEVARLPAGTPVVWLDSDTAMMAALLEGAWALPALPYAAIGGPDRLLARLPPDGVAVMAGTPPEPLNNRSRSGGLRPHFLGWSLDELEMLELRLPGEAIPALRLRLAAPEAVGIEVLSGGTPCAAAAPPLPAEPGWTRVHLPACAAPPDRLRLRFACPGDRCAAPRLTGISLGPPRAGLDWPWAQGRVVALARSGQGVAGTDFSLEGLLRANRAADLLGRLADVEPLADASGVVWLRARVTP